MGGRLVIPLMEKIRSDCLRICWSNPASANGRIASRIQLEEGPGRPDPFRKNYIEAFSQ